MIKNEKAQLYTIEAIASALLLVMVVILVLKAAPMTPNSSSSSHQAVEVQLKTQGYDLLTVLDHPEGTYPSQLKKAILNWDGIEYLGQAAIPSGPVNDIAIDFKEALGDAGIVYNLEIFFYTSTGVSSRPMFWNGKPSDNAVIISKSIVLNQEDLIGNPGLISIIPENDPYNSEFYNIVEVKLTIWRM